jgi:putative DNA methylase
VPESVNPVAVLINKAMIEIPPKFAGQPPVNPEDRKRGMGTAWKGPAGIAADVRYYGKWMRDEAERRIGHLYPQVEITADMARDRPDLKPLVGRKLTVIAWLWARTVESPNPAFAGVDVPLAATFVLTTKPGKEAYVQPIIDGRSYHFTVRIGKPPDAAAAQNGTKLARGANFKCLMSGTPISGDYIKSQGKSGRMAARMMAVVVQGERGRVFLSPSVEMERAASQAVPDWEPDTVIPPDKRSMFTPLYGLTHFKDLYTPRQLVALTTFADLVQEAHAQIMRAAEAVGLPADSRSLAAGGTGSVGYADAIGVYLAFAVSRLADYGSSIATWRAKDNAMRSTLAMQAIPMTWDFAEGSPFGDSSAGFTECCEVIARVLPIALGSGAAGTVNQNDAAGTYNIARCGPVVSTDPPYYDNIGYADLSDFFYVWLRRSLRATFPDLFATLAVPKADELVATPYRHGSKENADAFFLAGMTRAMHQLSERSHPAFPVTIYYAFKQAETRVDTGTASTGWETFLDAVIRAGFAVSGTWPMRTEGDNRQMGIGSNALASSIVLVCHRRSATAPAATRRDFLAALKGELPDALRHLQHGNIAPVDLAQAAIGPGMAVYTRYAKVVDAENTPLSVRQALALINETLDQVLAEQEGDFDADTRWAVAWFDQYGFSEADYGAAELLSKAKNTSVLGMAEAGILTSRSGKVRILRPVELPTDWDPATDRRLTVWEMVHQLIRVLEADGESAAAALAARLGSQAETARELAYRLYTVCERKKRAAEALSYNGLVQSWPEITRLARQAGAPRPEQGGLFAGV